MTLSKTRREKVAEHMTGAGRTPEELAVAQAWLAENGTPLERIAEQIKAEWGKGIETQFAIGRLLVEARSMFNGDKEFGQWVRSQGLPFSQPVAWRLREAASQEPEVRAYIAAHSTSNVREISVATAIEYMRNGPKKAQPNAEAIPVTDTTPADPAFVALRNAYNVVMRVVEGEPTGNAFLTMHVDDLIRAAGFIKAMAAAYQNAKVQRGG